MSANDYHFVTRWRVKATPEQVYAVLGDPLDLPRWWPDVYLDAREVQPADANGLNRVVTLRTKGFLPYRLKWAMRVTEVAPYSGFALAATGDFEGGGRWSFTADGEWTDIEFDWRIVAEKPLLRTFSFALKPLFSWNHEWAMKKGLESLTQELGQRYG